MALVINKTADNTPQTHVLIIGVGHYPYLSGGASTVPQTFGGVNQLTQLTSPCISAKAFCETVLSFDKPNASIRWKQSLGSVELLLSPLPQQIGNMADIPYDAATRVNIENAYREWKQRCNTHSENIAVFYFCGHGLEKESQFLLAEDFGRNPDNPWNGAIDMDLTRRAFHACKANTQLFFIDACRQVTASMLTHQLSVSAIDIPSMLTADCLYNLTLKGAANNESAFGRRDDISYFTKALINGLTGHAATKVNDDWVIITGTLASKMTQFIQLLEPGQGFRQRCTSNLSDSTDVIHFGGPPEVDLFVSCDPDEALAAAELTYENLHTSVKESRAPLKDPWKVRVAAGVYNLSAQFQQPPFQNGSKVCFVMPPIVNEKILCQ